jgi:hypothetical protein
LTVEDAFFILGLPRKASVGEIRSRFRSLSKKYHPDTSEFATFFEKGKAARKFIRIKEAYDVLMAANLTSEPEPIEEEEAKKQPTYKTTMLPNDPFQDKFFNKIGDSRWTELVGMFFAIPFMLFFIFAMPINVGLSYLFFRLGLESESNTIKGYSWRLIRFVISLALGSLLVYLYFIKDEMYFVLAFLIGGSVFTILEIGSFCYFIFTLKKIRRDIVIHSV